VLGAIQESAISAKSENSIIIVVIHYSVATLRFFRFSSFVLRFSDACPIVSILHFFKISFVLRLPFLRKRSLQRSTVLVFSATKQNKRTKIGIFLLLQAIKRNNRVLHVIFLLLYGRGRNKLVTNVIFRALQEKSENRRTIAH